MKITCCRVWLTTLILTTISACGGGGSSSQSELADRDFAFSDMMKTISDDIVIPRQKTAEQTTTTFASEVLRYCESIGSDNEVLEQASLQESWNDAMDAVQWIDSYAFTPSTDNSSALKQRIHSFSATRLSHCGLDQAVVRLQNGEYDINTRSFNQRGMGAVEYLLFNDDLDHNCSLQISETRLWNNLPDDVRKVQRCELAQVISNDVASASAELVGRWDLDRGNFRSVFLNPENLSASLEQVLDTLFYIELIGKDDKLGLPTQINSECSGEQCLNALESPFTRRTFNNLLINLQSFLEIYQGANGLSFDDLIRDKDLNDIADQYKSFVDQALRIIETSVTDLETQALAIQNDASEDLCLSARMNPSTESSLSACRLYGQLKLLTDSLRTEFLGAVNLDLPERAQSDND